MTGQPTLFTRHDFGGPSKLLWLPGEHTPVVLSADFNRARNKDGLGSHIRAVSFPRVLMGYQAIGVSTNTYDNSNGSC